MSAAQSQIFGRDSKGRNQPYAISDPVAATQVLTFSGQPANGETFTIGGQVYTFVTALTIGTPNQVKIGVDTATSIANATAAVMKGDGQDTAYTAATLKNANVTAVAASTTLTVTAITPGADGNNITTTESIANASWGAATLTGGAYGVLVVGNVSGGGIPVTPQTVTPNFFAPATTTPVVIPAGAIGASILILTGTGTLNGVDQPVGVPWTEPNKLATTVTLVLGSPGTARVYYGT